MEDQVLTNSGYKKFKAIKKSIHKKYYEIKFLSGDILKCTSGHIFETPAGPITAKKLKKTDELIHKDGNTFYEYKKLIRKKFVAYDLVDVDSGSIYYTNNILSHNCSFLGSSNTLISGSKLMHLVATIPEVEQQYLSIYKQPEEGHIYVATVDTGAGLSQDYSVVNIIDVTSAPYHQVCVYRNSEIDPSSFATLVYKMAKKYNYATLVVESNNDGKVVCRDLFDMEYENMINTKNEMGENTIKTGRRSIPGIMMTKLTKRVGCVTLKDLIETEVLIINNKDTISELGNFVKKGSSYEAEPGKHDDIVMCLVMFAWFSTTDYFTDITGKITKDEIKKNRNDDDIYDIIGFISGDEIEEQPFNFNFW